MLLHQNATVWANLGKLWGTGSSKATVAKWFIHLNGSSDKTWQDHRLAVMVVSSFSPPQSIQSTSPTRPFLICIYQPLSSAYSQPYTTYPLWAATNHQCPGYTAVISTSPVSPLSPADRIRPAEEPPSRTSRSAPSRRLEEKVRATSSTNSTSTRTPSLRAMSVYACG